MKRRLLKKKVRRLEDLDAELSACFQMGGHRRYSLLIYTLRAEIRYIKRRWPKAYERAFGGGFDLGHQDAGRGPSDENGDPVWAS